MGLEFESEFVVFTDALDSRQSTFGSLTLEEPYGFSDNDMKRQFRVNNITQLCLPFLDTDDDLDLLACAAKVGSLDCHICTSSLETDLTALKIAAKRLCIVLDHFEGRFFPLNM
jgi:hypothetical protein